MTFDLIGLPPTPAEIDAFVADNAPDAYDKLVDRLLASPRYGERWARHWLDVVHYADTHGYDKDKLRPNAWHYRDYVIRALNEDKPYTRFVREQLAGDVLYPDHPDGVVATGFIAAGPWDLVGQTEVSEETSNGKLVRNLDRDDMVMNAMSTFTSLTVHCARCHNHKFDPISQQDYYSLQSVFSGIGRIDRPYDGDPEIASQRKQLLAQKAQLTASLALSNEKFNALKSPELAMLDVEIETLRKQAILPPADGAAIPSPTLGYHSSLATTADEARWVQVDLGASRPVQGVYLAPVWHQYGGWAGPGWGFPHRFKVEASDDATFTAGVTLLSDHLAADFPNPGDAPVAVDCPPNLKARYVRVTAMKLWLRNDAYIFALSELAVLSDGRNIAAGANVTALDSIESPGGWGRAFLVDGKFGRTSFEQLTRQTGKPSPTNGYHSLLEPKPDAIKWVQLDLGKAVALSRVRLVPARPTDFPDTPGFGFPVRYKVEASNDVDFAHATLLADHTDADVVNPRDQPVVIEGREAEARFVRVTATKLWKRSDDFCFALAELEAESHGQLVSRNAPVSSLDTIESGRWSRVNLTDGYSSRTALATPLGTGVDVFVRAATAGTRLHNASVRRNALLAAAVPPVLREELATTQLSLAQVNDRLARLPQPAMTYAVANMFAPLGAYYPPHDGKPRHIHVLNRGNVTDEREEVGPGAVDAIKPLKGRFAVAHADVEGERRVALADWIADHENPLTWRSFVNRVWHYHFGKGLVESTNDFGHMGSPPSHPELLDYLAAEFRDGSQSIKSLHRLIVTSATYRQSSANDPAKEKLDAGNRMLWRMNRRRLEAEAVRDSILQTSGKLDLSMGGPGYFLFGFMDDHSPHYLYEEHDPDDPKSLRRTIYRFIVRSVPDPLMTTLDCPDPSLINDKRFETVTPLQSLAMLNDAFMVREAQHFAERLQREAPTLPGQIAVGYRIALSRAPSEEESAKLVEYGQHNGLPNVCRVLFNLNEFVFID